MNERGVTLRRCQLFDAMFLMNDSRSNIDFNYFYAISHLIFKYYAKWFFFFRTGGSCREYLFDLILKNDEIIRLLMWENFQWGMLFCRRK